MKFIEVDDAIRQNVVKELVRGPYNLRYRVPEECCQTSDNNYIVVPMTIGENSIHVNINKIEGDLSRVYFPAMENIIHGDNGSLTANDLFLSGITAFSLKPIANKRCASFLDIRMVNELIHIVHKGGPSIMCRK